MILCAAKCLDAFAFGSGGGVNVFRDGRGTDEGNGADERMFEESVDHFPAPMQQGDDTGLETGIG